MLTCERGLFYKAKVTPGIKNTITSAVPSAKFLKLTDPDVVISSPLDFQFSTIVKHMHKHILLRVLVAEVLQPVGKENNLNVSDWKNVGSDNMMAACRVTMSLCLYPEFTYAL